MDSLSPSSSLTVDQQQLYLISNRKNFEDRNKFSTTTQIARIFSSSRGDVEDFETFDHAEIFHNRKILILIHGFTVTYQDALATLDKVADRVHESYDTVIGYLYPACASHLQYRKAKKQGLLAAKNYLFPVLLRIRQVAQHLDISAHSMGTIVAAYALNQSEKLRIDNLFMLGGALDEENIFDCDGHKCTQLQQALANAGKIYIFYTCKDAVLPWLDLFNPTQTIGAPGEKIIKRSVSKNICLVDATSIVDSHSGYYNSTEIFGFFKKAVEGTEECLEQPYLAFKKGKLKKVSKPSFCSMKKGIPLAVQTQLSQWVSKLKEKSNLPSRGRVSPTLVSYDAWETKSGNPFHHRSLDEIASLYAMGPFIENSMSNSEIDESFITN